MNGRRRRVRANPARRYGRTAATALVTLTLAVGAPFVSAGGAKAETSAFSNGKATAFAQVLRVSPGVGSLQLGMSSGVAVTQITNSLAQAQAQAVDLGLIGTSLTAQQCDGSPGSVRADQLPQPLSVDNRKGPTSASKDEYPIGGAAIGGGRKEVSVDTVPSGHATATTTATVLGPLASISSARSDAVTRIVDAQAREAQSSVDLDLDIAGVVQLHGLRWSALHRTGANPGVAGSFTVASASAGSVPLPADQLAPLQDAVNKALAESGITIEMPRVEHLTAPNDLLRVTPLRITLKDSPAGKTAIGPGLNLTRAQREQLFDSIVAVYCKAASLLLVGDISVAVASGTGFLIAEIGGVEASSADLVAGNPFGSFLPFTPAISPPLALADAPNVAGRVAGPSAAPSVKPGTVVPARATGPIAQVCESLHLGGSQGCSRGAGLPIGLAGLGLTAGVGFLDWRRQRRLLAAAAEAIA